MARLAALVIAELLDDEDQLPDEIPEPPEADVLTARGLVLRLRRLEREAERVKAIRDAVAASYDGRLAHLAVAEAQTREWLGNYVRRHGTLRLPDVGTVFLTPKKPEPRFVIDSIADATRYAETTGVGIVTKRAFSKTAYVEQAQRWAETKGGEVLPGIVYEAPEQRVVVRAA